MGAYTLLKKYLAIQIVEQLLEVLSHNPETRLITLTRVVERLAPTAIHRQQIATVRKIFEDSDNNWTRLACKVLKYIGPSFREKGVVNFFVNALWLGFREREAFARREGVPAPFTVVISPTMRCNLRCIGCYAGQYGKSNELSTEEVDRIVSEAKSMGSYFITISGGEPFVREDLFDIFKKHDDAIFMVYTNGTLIDRDVARRLSELGNVSPAISLEGFEAETDARRGKGTFARVMQAMDNLREVGVVFGFSATATRHNTEVVASDNFIRMVIDKGAIYGWYFTFVPVGKDPDPSLMPTPEQRNRLRAFGQYVRATYPIFVGDFWNDGPLTCGCIAGGRSYLHVNANGDIEPCVFTHFAQMNIRDATLKDALQSPFFRAIRARQPFNSNHLRPCMLIDNPNILREILAEVEGVRPTHEGAELLVTQIAGDMDTYASVYGEIADKVWEEEYLPRQQKAAQG